MPGRIQCIQENLLGLSWHDSAWVPMLNSSNVLEYFSERTNPFYDRTCNNEIIKMQRLNPDQLCNMTGLEYILLHVQEPILYVIRKQDRQSSNQTIPIADYYIIAGVIYQAPDLISVINSRLLTSVFHLQSAFDDLFNMMQYQPSKGYSWDIKSQMSTTGIIKKDLKEEPSSNFQRQRVDMLLMELTRRFPLPVMKHTASESKYSVSYNFRNIVSVENPLEIQSSRSETTPPIKTEKIDEIVSIKEERSDQIITSPSMKPPPEKKSRLN
ncbi:hypothetical protein PGB90_007386 [Kerria lacca]